MKKHIFFYIWIIVGLAGSFFAAVAQDTQEGFDREAFMAKRNAYITAEVQLTAEEAAVFIPMENEMQKRKFEIWHECRKLLRKSKTKENMTDEERQKLIDCNNETRIKVAELEKEYYEKFKKTLSVEKLYKYQEADAKFMRKFMKERGRQKENPYSD